MNEALRELVKISNAVGSDSSFVLGGFGNTSVKTADGRFMYIKQSGTALKDMTSRGGWRRLKLDSVLAILKDRTLGRMAVGEREDKMTEMLFSACEDKFCVRGCGARAAARPSVESCFHSMLDRVVIHLHPAAVLAYCCAKEGQGKLEKLFKQDSHPPVWVPYANPGYMLARRIEKLTCDYKARYGRAAAIMFLQNHGLIAAANNSNTALQLVRRVVNICDSKLKRPEAVKIQSADDKAIRAAKLAIRRAVLQTTGKAVTIRHFMNETIAGFMARGDGRRLCSGGAVTPDELIYANGAAMWLDTVCLQTVLDKLNRRIARGQGLPAGFLVKPLGLFVAGGRGRLPLIKDVIITYLAVRGFAADLGGIHPLNKRQRRFITSRYDKG
jgi:rhamnose utilization protein RhaD (predicted bifunctional aldolase and dehydrogenase)